jgi:hypothetical protein
VAFHILFGQLDADGKDADGEDNPGELEGDGVRDIIAAAAPAAGVEDVGAVRADNHTEDESPYGFANIQLKVRQPIGDVRRGTKTHSFSDEEGEHPELAMTSVRPHRPRARGGTHKDDESTKEGIDDMRGGHFELERGQAAVGDQGPRRGRTRKVMAACAGGRRTGGA